MNATTARRVVVTFVALASIALAGATSVHAADPDTLGLTVWPAPIHVDEGRTFTILNEGTVRTTYTFVTPTGWRVEPESVDIDPGATAVVRLDGTGSGGVMTVNGTMTAAVTAKTMERTVAAMEVRIVGPSPFDPSPWIWGALTAILIIAAVFLVGRRVLRFARSFTIVRKES